MKKILFVLLILFLLIVVIIILANYIINHYSEDKIYNDIAALPAKKTALVLGASKTLSNGQSNLYFEYRINAAAALYKAGKVKAFVLSGDNSTKGYSEPEDMKVTLMAKGVPASMIYLDYAGLRTFDSVYRMKAIFMQDDFIIVSQEFHNQRALYIAQYLGINAIAFNAQDVAKNQGFKTKQREKLARVKVFIDLWTNKQPKFLGNTIEIKI